MQNVPQGRYPEEYFLQAPCTLFLYDDYIVVCEDMRCVKRLFNLNNYKVNDYPGFSCCCLKYSMLFKKLKNASMK